MHVVQFAVPATKFLPVQPFMPEAQFVRQQNTFSVGRNDPHKNSRKPQFHKRNSHQRRDRFAGIPASLKSTPDEIRQLSRRYIPNDIFHQKLSNQLLRFLQPDSVTKSFPAVPLLYFFLHEQIRLLLIRNPACYMRKIPNQQLTIFLHQIQYTRGIPGGVSPQYQPFTLQNLWKPCLFSHAVHFRNYSCLESTSLKLPTTRFCLFPALRYNFLLDLHPLPSPAP